MNYEHIESLLYGKNINISSKYNMDILVFPDWDDEKNIYDIIKSLIVKEAKYNFKLTFKPYYYTIINKIPFFIGRESWSYYYEVKDNKLYLAIDIKSDSICRMDYNET